VRVRVRIRVGVRARVRVRAGMRVRVEDLRHGSELLIQVVDLGSEPGHLGRVKARVRARVRVRGKGRVRVRARVRVRGRVHEPGHLCLGPGESLLLELAVVGLRLLAQLLDRLVLPG